MVKQRQYEIAFGWVVVVVFAIALSALTMALNEARLLAEIDEKLEQIQAQIESLERRVTRLEDRVFNSSPASGVGEHGEGSTHPSLNKSSNTGNASVAGTASAPGRGRCPLCRQLVVSP